MVAGGAVMRRRQWWISRAFEAIAIGLVALLALAIFAPLIFGGGV
jgi:hypothetical protein